MLKRTLDIANLLKKKSFFLFGLRGVGKSSLIKQQFQRDTPIIDLLRSELYLRLSANPQDLEAIIDSYPKATRVIIDEVQRVPMLLNEVHRLIENRGLRFLLTGSSARKLKQKNINLLAGRAWEADLLPLTYSEIPNFNLKRYLLYGGLPAVYLSKEPREELYAYVNTYLQEEIQSEALVRKIPAFSRFLQISALSSSKIINFTNIANDSGVPTSTIREYYQILEDTFVGFTLPAWTKSVKRKAISTAKFYFSDIGTKNILAQIEAINDKTELFGESFEHFIALELRAYISYERLHQKLSYWQSKHGYEVDFIIGDNIAIEVKSTNKIHDKHLKGLLKLKEENICVRYILISHDTVNRKCQGIEMIFWRDFLEKLWQGTIL